MKTICAFSTNKTTPARFAGSDLVQRLTWTTTTKPESLAAFSALNATLESEA